jgi:2-hydroxychromene-2-carboxylate isomerase
MTKTIDYFFSIGSPWSFIGHDAFVDLARRFGAEIRPILTTVIEENGGIYARNRPDARRAYWTKDLKRWSAVRGKALNFDNRAALSDPTPASFSVIAADIDGKDWAALTIALQEAFWLRAEDIGAPDVRKQIADRAGLDGAALLARETDSDVQERWQQNRETALKGGVFGFPSYRFERELYWGQDNLDFLERHLKGEPILV